MIVDGEVPTATEHAGDCGGVGSAALQWLHAPSHPARKQLREEEGQRGTTARGHQQSSGVTSYISTATSLLWKYVGEC